jgi:hypothetical protein
MHTSNHQKHNRRPTKQKKNKIIIENEMGVIWNLPALGTISR